MRRSASFGYVTALLLVAAATVLEAALWRWVQPSLSPLFTAAVVFCALYSGLRPALLATALSVVASAFFFLPPTQSLSIGIDDALRLLVFAGVALVVSSVAAARRAAELRLREAREFADAANLAKDRLLAVVSHELRGPLSPVLMIASSMEANEGLPPVVREDAGTVRRSVELQARIIEDLLDTSRIERGKLELRRQIIDAHDVIRDSVAICVPEASAKSVRLELESVATGALVYADAGRLRQVMGNLIRNAMKFTPAGGRVIVRTSSDERGWLRVDVVDTGAGIAADVLPRIFNAFEQGGQSVTKRYGGLGLGLAIVKGIVEAHGGEVAARSEGVGQGATFSVDLPTAPVPAAREEPREVPPRRPADRPVPARVQSGGADAA